MEVTITFNKFILHIVLAVFFAWLGNMTYTNIFGTINWIIAFLYALTSIGEAIIITASQCFQNKKR